ncbi:hypothetical protein TSOC_008893 [Tetrabaena socialis]|uniref:EF-hand domain-containing protein n=1 Tax=Tetrabaena socialis TaxID=47790 RepID=A0A2J7ZX79_9CHLO|nr:hypothetical protein TSOC_008893 [Tetrabaena socialis]|eukprot:PNH04855.1 hypothetical protein TSOC_008893 [Tetrabaena socialis]
MLGQPDAELRQTHEALSCLLLDDGAFESVLNAVFEHMDGNRDGRLDPVELETYIGEACKGMGLEAPQKAQVQGVFNQMDLNDDAAISRDELAIFLRHFFQEQVKFCALKLHRL